MSPFKIRYGNGKAKRGELKMVVLPPSLAAGENGPVKVGTLTPEELFAQLPGRKM